MKKPARDIVCLAAGITLGLATLAATAQDSDIPRFDIDRYVVEGNSLLDAGQIDELLAPYRGTSRNFGTVQQALETLENAYRAAGYATVQVTLPEQELNAGRVVLRVIEGRLRQVQIEGNRHFGHDNIRASLPALKEGRVPDVEALGASLRVANENASKQTQLVLRAGQQEGEIDALVTVRDESPTRSFVSLDNTGTRETGRSRLGIGWQHNNLFDSDHSLTLRYTTSEHPERVAIYGAGYHIPLYAKGHSIDVFGGYSDVSSGVVNDLFNVSGKGSIAGIRYNQQLSRIGALEHKFTYGADYRAYKNDTRPLGGGESITPDYTTHPLSVTYDVRIAGLDHETGLYATLAYQPGGTGKSGLQTFRSVRAGATDAYRILRLGTQHTRQLPGDWQLRAQISAQHTPDALVPGEQFGLGGNVSVRGFGERELANDRGVNANLELYTPDIGRHLQEGSSLRALIFFDGGRVWRNRALPGEPDTQGIASLGAGLRFGIGKSFSLKFDAARIVEEHNYERSEAHPKIHVGLGYIF